MGNEKSITSTVNWVKEEMPIKSMREVAIGFMIGAIKLSVLAICSVDGTERKDSQELEETIKGIMKRRLPEIVKKIDSELGV